MTKADFINSVKQASPLAGLDPMIQALWYDAKCDWNKAHEIVQDFSS